MQARRELRAGIKSELPVAAGVIPFGMIFGVVAVAAGIPPLLAQDELPGGLQVAMFWMASTEIPTRHM